MKILADENIAELGVYFAAAGELVTMPGRAIDAAAVRDADALLVRSVTRVDAALLENSSCRFVGTATSGIDHIDVECLRRQNIAFASALGCNANSVVEYVIGAMALLSSRLGFDWREQSFGIVGCGEIGSRLVRKLQALGIRCLVYDPFLDESHSLAAAFRTFAEVLAQDVVSFHTPLTSTGAWPTWHMLDENTLPGLKPSSILINAARGAVVDNAALLRRLERHPGQLAVLDAWEGEPRINHDLMRKVVLATPHIAGYSREGKVNGTRVVAEAFYRHFGMNAPEEVTTPDQSCHRLEVDTKAGPLAQLNELVLKAYDVSRDHLAMQGVLRAERPEKFFDDLRKHYPERREFSHFGIAAAGLSPEVAAQAASLGFRVL